MLHLCFKGVVEMNPVRMFDSVLNTNSLLKASMVSLRPGQLLYGSVEKLFPNGTAIIQVGNMRLFAQLKANINDTDSYWFEVRSGGSDGMELKLLEGIEQKHPGELLLKNLQLPETKQNLQLLELISLKNLPISKDQLKLAATWVTNQGALAKELTALEWMIDKELPFTKQIFQSLVAVQESQSFYEQLEEVGRYLEQTSIESSKTIQSLRDVISSILDNSQSNEIENGKAIQHLLRNLVQLLGLEYEKEVQLWTNAEQDPAEPFQSLKPLLMKAMMELGENGKELEPLLNRLTGMQLISQDSIGPMLQMVLQLPFSFGGKQSDITLQWSGRKTNSGQIDPDFCRILFHLELQSLEQTVIDMQVQNKVVHLSVINDKHEIEPIVRALTPTLKEKLESNGYMLSFVKVNPTFEKKQIGVSQPNPMNLSTDLYKRVDIKI
jgi:hypothetical protein